MKIFVVAALAIVGLAAEVHPDTTYKSAPIYTQPTYKTYDKNYDYPPRPYSFDYAVKDDYSYVDFNHNEYSDGKVVSGIYRVVLPDGRVQTVSYKDEGYGLTADVKYEGTAQYPSHRPTEYKPSHKLNNPANYQKDKTAYTQSKPVYDQPQLAYEQTKPVYEASKYLAQPLQRPVFNPAPVHYRPAPVAYKPAPADYKTATYKPSSIAYNPAQVTYKQAPTVYKTAPTADSYTAAKYPVTKKY